MIYVEPNYFRHNQVDFGEQVWFSFKDKLFKFQVGDERFGIGYLKCISGDYSDFFFRLGLPTKGDVYKFYAQCLGYNPEKTVDGVPLVKYGDVIGMTKVVYELLRLHTLNTCLSDLLMYSKIDEGWENETPTTIN